MFMFPGMIDSILDIGAYIGDDAIFARMGHPKARIISLEPSLHAYDSLVNNVEGLKVETYRLALGNGLLGKMTLEKATVSNVFINEDNTMVKNQDNQDIDMCPSMFLSDMVQHFQLSGNILIKINCEGGERGIFNHEPSLQTLSEAKVILIECHGRKTIQSFLDLSMSRFSPTHEIWKLPEGSIRSRADFRLVAKGFSDDNSNGGQRLN